MGNVFKIRELRYIPRWSVFLIDVSFIFFSILVSYFLLNSLEVKLNFTKYQKENIFSVVLINILCIVLFKTYAGIIRHSTFFDFFKIVWSSGSALIVLLGLNFMSELILGKPVFLYPVLFLFFFVSIFLMFFFRMAIKKLFGVLIDSKDTLSKARIAIVGVEDTSVSLAKAIIHNPDHPYQLAGFLTARSDSKKARLLGHKIYNKKQFLKSDSLKEQFDAVLIKDVMTKQEIEEWTSFALDKGLKVLKVPVTNIIKEDDKVRSIPPLQIEDVLNRPTIKILDLAERMIKLSGYTPGIDIKIDFIGLRPDEKLYEELLPDNSTTIPTHHEKIMISRDPLMKFEYIDIFVLANYSFNNE